MTDLFETVQKYHARGYSCVPCVITFDGMKKTVCWPKHYKAVQFDTAEQWDTFRCWDRERQQELTLIPNGVAIRTDGLVVADLDVKQRPLDAVKGDLAAAGFSLSGGIVADTPSGGEHRLYRQPAGPAVSSSQGVPVEGMDIRAEGGMLFVYPTPGYKFRTAIPAKDNLPVLPAANAKILQEFNKSVPAVIEAPDGHEPADCTPAQREYALTKIDYKLDDLSNAVAGQRWEANKVVMRIFGLAKTIGDDLEVTAKKVRSAYEDSQGDAPEQIDTAIRNAVRNAVMEDPRSWPTADFSPVGFWESRPELTHIYNGALARTTSPWAVLGAVAVRVLAMVPPSWQSFGEARGHGNFNLFSVLVGTSGAGKGGANAVAKALVPFGGRDIVMENPVSGEAIPGLFGPGVESVVIDMPEYATLSTNADRPGSTLVPTLCKAFSGEGLGVARADSTRSSRLPAGSYRMGVIAGIQYDNAGMMLSPSAVATGLPQRFVWLPLNISESEAPDRTPVWPGPLPVNLPDSFGIGDTVKEIPIPGSVDAQLRKIGLDVLYGRVALSAQDAHRLYAQQKVAYFLAVINGHFDSIRESDWMLAEQVMFMSDATRKRAVNTMRKRDSALQKVRGEQAAERKVASDDYEYSLKVTRAANSIHRWLLKRPDMTGPRGSAINCLDSPLREPFGDPAVEQLVGEGRGVLSPDGKYITAVQRT